MNEKKSLTMYLVGSALYLLTLSLNSWAGGQWLDINEVWFTPGIPLCFFCIFYSVALLDCKTWAYALVSALFACSLIFSIPNVSYPIGSSYFETLETALSRVSGVGYAFATVVYCWVMLSAKR